MIAGASRTANPEVLRLQRLGPWPWTPYRTETNNEGRSLPSAWRPSVNLYR